MAGCRALRIATLAGVFAVICVRAGAGQAPPLRKTDLVRLLTSPSLTTAQVVERIRGACLAFDPSERDRADLQALGAHAAVMAQINDCVRRKAAAARRLAQPAAAAPRPTPPARAVAAARPETPARQTPRASGLRIASLQRRFSAEAGTEAVVQVQVTRDGRAVPGVALTLTGVGAQAVTDAQGVATFRVPAGPTVRLLRVAVVPAGNEAAAEAPEVEVATVAGPPAAVDVQPARLEFQPAAPARPQLVTVTVRDAQGNAVTGERVEFRPLTPDIGIGAFGGQTNASGQLSASFTAASLERSGVIGIFVRGARLGSLGIVLGSVVVSDARTRFVAGEGQRGLAGQALDQPLVLEVRDTTGTPVVGQTVTFAATNGEVTPASAATDARGQVSVTVTLGRQAGSTRVAAGVGSLRKEVTIPVAPGPAATLVIRRDTVPVAGSLVVRSRQPVLLRVAARDSFGNEVPASGLRAMVRGEGVLRVARAEADGGAGRVELRPQGTGSADIDIEAAGVRETLAAQVLLAAAGGGWMLALRGGWTAFEYSYSPPWRGRPGFLGEVVVGRGLGGGFALAVAATVAGLKADTVSGAASPLLLVDGSMRLEYSVRPHAKVAPVVSLGGGAFQTRSAELGDVIRHTSLFWLAGAGLHFNLRERLAIELRVTTHQFSEATSTVRNARVGSLLALTAGIRFGN